MAKTISKSSKNQTMVQMAFFCALIIALQLLGTLLIRLGAVAPALAPIPMVIGCFIFGYKGALVLGSVFGFVTLICGVTGFDVYTNHMFAYKPLETALICFVKALVAALIGVVVYKLVIKITKGNILPAVIASSVIVPVVNTSIYIAGMALFFQNVTDLDGNAYYSFTADDTLMAVIIAMFGMIIVNFIMEVIVTPICCTATSMILSKSKQYKRFFIKK